MANKEYTTGGLGRRQFIKLAGYGAFGVLAGGTWPSIDFTTASQLTAADRKPRSLPDLDLSLIARPAQVPIFPGEPTQVWQYQAIVHRGSQDRVIKLPRSYLGPIIKAWQGEKIRIRFTNSIPEESIIHWHGLHVPAIMDGHPRHVIPQGQSYLYEFEIPVGEGVIGVIDLALAETASDVYLVALCTDKEDDEPLREAAFIPAVDSILIATVRAIRLCLAWYTTPTPPLPNLFRIT